MMRALRKRRLARKLKPGEATMSAVITRADGRVEDLGVISRGKLTLKPEAKSWR